MAIKQLFREGPLRRTEYYVRPRFHENISFLVRLNSLIGAMLLLQIKPISRQKRSARAPIAKMKLCATDNEATISTEITEWQTNVLNAYFRIHVDGQLLESLTNRPLSNSAARDSKYARNRRYFVPSIVASCRSLSSGDNLIIQSDTFFLLRPPFPPDQQVDWATTN